MTMTSGRRAAAPGFHFEKIFGVIDDGVGTNPKGGAALVTIAASFDTLGRVHLVTTGRPQFFVRKRPSGLHLTERRKRGHRLRINMHPIV
jgi:hypothetical protein